MKKFKTKKRFNYIKLFFLIGLLILFSILSFYKLGKSYPKLVNVLTHNFYNDDVVYFSLTNNLDYLINSYSFKNSEIVYQEKSKRIYLYNTHDLEKYNDGTTIIEATRLLKNNLNRLGIDVIQEEKRVSEYLHTGLSNYNISRLFLKNIIDKENEITYFIDIHRDSVSDTSITINNKKYAKILFVLGLENKNYSDNLKVINKMNNYLNEKYPGLSRGIYKKKGSGVDGVYNEDLDKNIILMEIGGIENNYEEVNNSTEIISLMLYDMFGD